MYVYNMNKNLDSRSPGARFLKNLRSNPRRNPMLT